jgi:hypothetical protein
LTGVVFDFDFLGFWFEGAGEHGSPLQLFIIFSRVIDIP